MSSINDSTINCATVKESEPVTEAIFEEIGVVGNQEEPQGSLFKSDEIETVDPEAKPKTKTKKNSGGGIFRIFTNKVTKTYNSLYGDTDYETDVEDTDEEDTEEKA